VIPDQTGQIWCFVGNERPYHALVTGPIDSLDGESHPVINLDNGELTFWAESQNWEWKWESCANRRRIA
jgi:hypothetical protein